MADHETPKPLAGILLLLVLAAWCLASNSLHSEAHAPLEASTPSAPLEVSSR